MKWLSLQQKGPILAGSVAASCNNTLPSRSDQLLTLQDGFEFDCGDQPGNPELRWVDILHAAGNGGQIGVRCSFSNCLPGRYLERDIALEGVQA